jgi:hypothetical protein
MIPLVLLLKPSNPKAAVVSAGMTIKANIIGKAVIGLFILSALIAEAGFAQNIATGPASAPSSISNGITINSGASASSMPSVGSGNPNLAPPNASLLAVPAVGTTPLTVDFYVGSENTAVSLIYEWNSAIT